VVNKITLPQKKIIKNKINKQTVVKKHIENSTLFRIFSLTEKFPGQQSNVSQSYTALYKRST